MSVLSLSITQRTISASDLSQIFSGAQNIDSIQVTFDSEWTGFTKKAVFTSTKEDCFFVALDSSNTAKIPATVLENSGTILIGVMGEKGDQRITSSLLRYRVGKGVTITDLLDPSAAKSILDLLNEALANTGGTTGTGTAGYTFTPSVSSDGVISWTNNGGLENPAPVSIKGPKGAEITAITQYFLRSSSSTGVTTQTSGWQTAIPTLSTTYPIMWTYFKVSFSDGTEVNSLPIIAGNYNERLSSISVYYLRNSSATTPSTSLSGWSTSYQEPTSASPYLWCHLRFTYYAYGSSSSHTVYSSVFRLKTYSSSSASGVVLDLSSSSNTNDTTQGDAALDAIQSGIMPVIYQNSTYMQVVKAQPINNCGTHYIRLTYLEPGCSGAIYTTVDWQTTK